MITFGFDHLYLLLNFLNPAWISGISQFMYCWSPECRILSILSFASEWDESNCAAVWIFFAIPFFGIGMKTDIFQPYGHGWDFQICWHIEFSIFTASSFRIWTSSTGIPSSPLPLFIVMLPKAHLTLHPRMSGSRWVITSWLSRSLRTFVYSSSVFSCHLFLVS